MPKEELENPPKLCAPLKCIVSNYTGCPEILIYMFGECEKEQVSLCNLLVYSSSETDEDQEWQRCQEAAVSAADILKQSGLQAPLPELSNGHRCETTESCQRKKRRKKPKVKEESDSDEQGILEKPQKNKVSVWTEKPSCLSGVHKSGECVATEDSGFSKEVMMIKKKKKRKKMEARTE